jgi:c-di-GMP-binding flagellar brake protein YcgR
MTDHLAMSTERRHAARVHAELRSGWCRLDELAQAQCYEAQTEDISTRGCAVISQKQMVEDTLVTITIMGVGDASLQLHIAATVIHVERLGGRYRCGLRFENVTSQQRAALTRFVLRSQADQAA